jgi:hypothetical protein
MRSPVFRYYTDAQQIFRFSAKVAERKSSRKGAKAQRKFHCGFSQELVAIPLCALAPLREILYISRAS